MSIRINQQRLWDSMMDMGEIGALDKGGCCRLALSKLDGEGRDLFVKWCKEAGCEINFDQAGNIYARRAGTDKSASAVATGSHLDTQPHGGKFDGIYGVLAGLEVIRVLNDHKLKTKHPIDVIVWTNEEGVRFSPPMGGSSVFAGSLPLESFHDASTSDGSSVIKDLNNLGYFGESIPGERNLSCLIEAHIEQGPILEDANLEIGVVTQVQGVRVLIVNVEGEDGHGGTVPMNSRKDAFRGGIEIAKSVLDYTENIDSRARMTIGNFDVSPGGNSTIPGHVTFSIDIRHPESKILDEIEDYIRAKILEASKNLSLKVTLEQWLRNAPISFDKEIISEIESVADELGYTNQKMPSGAGHDAMNIAKVTPTAMIFVPCKNGISHNESEYASPEQLAAGTNVLLHTMMRRAVQVK